MQRRGETPLLVKGKWVGPYVYSAARSYFGEGTPVDLVALQSVLPRALATSVDATQPWASHWHDALDAL